MTALKTCIFSIERMYTSRPIIWVTTLKLAICSCLRFGIMLQFSKPFLWVTQPSKIQNQRHYLKVKLFNRLENQFSCMNNKTKPLHQFISILYIHRQCLLAIESHQYKLHSCNHIFLCCNTSFIN